MAKIIISASIDEGIAGKAKAIAAHDRRNFSTIVEIALEELIKRYEKLTGLSFTPESSPESTPVAEVAQ